MSGVAKVDKKSGNHTAYYHSSNDIRFEDSIMNHLKSIAVSFSEEELDRFRMAFKAPAKYASSHSHKGTEVDLVMRALHKKVSQYQAHIFSPSPVTESISSFFSSWFAPAVPPVLQDSSESQVENLTSQQQWAVDQLYDQFVSTLDATLEHAEEIDNHYRGKRSEYGGYTTKRGLCYTFYNDYSDDYTVYRRGYNEVNFVRPPNVEALQYNLCQMYLNQIRPEFTMSLIYRKIVETLNTPDMFNLLAYAPAMQAYGENLISNPADAESRLGKLSEKLRSFAHTFRNVYNETEYNNLDNLTLILDVMFIGAFLTEVCCYALGLLSIAAAVGVVTTLTGVAFVGALICTDGPGVLAAVSDMTASTLEFSNKMIGWSIKTLGDLLDGLRVGPSLDREESDFKLLDLFGLTDPDYTQLQLRDLHGITDPDLSDVRITLR